MVLAELRCVLLLVLYSLSRLNQIGLAQCWINNSLGRDDFEIGFKLILAPSVLQRDESLVFVTKQRISRSRSWPRKINSEIRAIYACGRAKVGDREESQQFPDSRFSILHGLSAARSTRRANMRRGSCKQRPKY